MLSLPSVIRAEEHIMHWHVYYTHRTAETLYDVHWNDSKNNDLKDTVDKTVSDGFFITL